MNPISVINKSLPLILNSRNQYFNNQTSTQLCSIARRAISTQTDKEAPKTWSSYLELTSSLGGYVGSIIGGSKGFETGYQATEKDSKIEKIFCMSVLGAIGVGAGAVIGSCAGPAFLPLAMLYTRKKACDALAERVSNDKNFN